jgi:hypothetical protein
MSARELAALSRAAPAVSASQGRTLRTRTSTGSKAVSDDDDDDEENDDYVQPSGRQGRRSSAGSNKSGTSGGARAKKGIGAAHPAPKRARTTPPSSRRPEPNEDHLEVDDVQKDAMEDDGAERAHGEAPRSLLQCVEVRIAPHCPPGAELHARACTTPPSTPDHFFPPL